MVVKVVIVRHGCIRPKRCESACHRHTGRLVDCSVQCAGQKRETSFVDIWFTICDTCFEPK